MAKYKKTIKTRILEEYFQNIKVRHLNIKNAIKIIKKILIKNYLYKQFY